ncbi:MAG: hypothetical protein AAGE05_10740 [Pseudomonadota bacterium]
MKTEIYCKEEKTPVEWHVEFIDEEGGVEQSIFIGTNAKQRAQTFAEMHYQPKASATTSSTQVCG